MSKTSSILTAILFVAVGISFLMIIDNNQAIDKIANNPQQTYDPIQDEKFMTWLKSEYITQEDLGRVGSLISERIDLLEDITSYSVGILNNNTVTLKAQVEKNTLDIQKNNDLIRNTQSPSKATVKPENITVIINESPQTDRSEYKLGDGVIVSGTADASSKVYGEIRNPDGKVVNISTVLADKDRKFQMVLWIPSEEVTGDWKVNVSTANATASIGVKVVE